MATQHFCQSIAVLSALLAGTAPSLCRAQAVSPVRPAPSGQPATPPTPAPSRDVEFGCGNIIVPQQCSYVVRPSIPRVALESVDAKIQIVEQVATTTMTIHLGNQSGRQLEAEMLVPVPDGAAVRQFTIGGGAPGSEPTARLLPKEEAKRIYEAIVRQARDPGLLEFAGYNLVRSSVFPVGTGGATVTLVYEHLLSSDGHRVDFALPRSQSLERNDVKWTISATIKCRQPISTVYSPSHEIITRRHGQGDFTIDLTPAAATQPGPFRLSYLLENHGVTASLMAYPDPETGGGYFLLLAGVPAEDADRKEHVQKREVVIVIDRSGSMKGEKIEQARSAAMSIVDGLEPGEWFNIIDYSDSVAMFADKAVVKDRTTTASARAYLQGIRAEGGTNIHEALLTAVRQKPAEGSLPMILFLTDGLPTVGNTSEFAIREDTARANAFKRRIFTFGVGFDVNAPLLDRIAEATRAASINVLPAENVETAVSTVFKRLNGPVMNEPRLVCVDANGKVNTRAVRELMPGVMPDLFEGDQLVVLGQYKDADELRFRLEGDRGGKAAAYEFQFRLDTATTRNAFVPRLWATRKIAVLVDQIRQRGAEAPSADPQGPAGDPRTKELVEEIVRLSTRFGILTEYTAFLATQPGDHGPAPRYSLGAATEQAGKNLQDRAVAGRAGTGAVSQSMNIKGQVSQGCTNAKNEFWDANMNRVSFATVQQIHDRTLFLRSGCWIDARIMEKDQEAKPERTIEFGSPEYFELADSLGAEGRPGIIAVRGDVYLLIKGQRVMVKGSEGPAVDGK